MPRKAVKKESPAEVAAVADAPIVENPKVSRRGKRPVEGAPEVVVPKVRKGKRPVEVEDAAEVVIPTVRKGKRAAEDTPDEEPVQVKKSKKPVVNGEVAGTSKSKDQVASSSNAASTKTKSKKATTTPATSTEASVSATLHCFGQGDCGQLGIECEKRKFPARVQFVKDGKDYHPEFVALACGGMHTLALENNGTVWSFGLNDDKALGRYAEEEDEQCKPGIVAVPGKVLQISAGDSHSAALTEDGNVYAWGCFKDDNGNFGLIADDGDVLRQDPELITADLGVKIVKIKSGAHHIAMLGEDAQLYTCGTGSQGQLGRSDTGPKRVTRAMTSNGEDHPSKQEFLLKPSIVKFGRSPKLSDIWTGEFSTYCISEKSRDIYVCGLNNYAQLGIKVKEDMKKNIIPKPTKVNSFKGKVWKQIAAGQHHALALDNEGKVYSIGRNSDGRLGLGTQSRDVEFYDEPQLVNGLANQTCVHVATGGSTSYAVTTEGHLYAWGFGENYQLANGDDEDRDVPTRSFGKKDTPIDGKVVCVAAGGQHVAVTISLPTDINGNS